MDEAETAKFRAAEERWQSGNVKDGARIHFDLCLNGQDPRIRLRSAMVLLDRLKFPQAPQEILQVCTVAIESAERLADTKNQALLMAKKAECLVTLNGLSLIPARNRLRMPPGWFGFGLEGEEKEYAELTKQIEANDKDADSLVSTARDIAERAGDDATLAHVLMCMGTMALQRYMSRKLDCLPSRIRVPGWLLSRLRECRLDGYVLYDSQTRHQLRTLAAECEERYLEAVGILQKASDEFLEAYAYYNLANNLRSMYRLGSASKYLRQAQALAEKQDNEQLLKSIHHLEKSIRLKNRDTPNYAAGERRPPEEPIS